MKKMILTLTLALGLASVTSVQAVEGDAAAGQAKSAVCAACHGADGNSLVPIYPNLAGQGEKYIAKQLSNFKDGSRKDPVMMGMVAALSEQDMADLAAYFSSQTAKPGKGEHNDLGQKLYTGGDAAKGITACVACHGVDGKGMDSAGFPAIAGQSVDYLKSQLMKFRKGERANDTNSMMRNIAKRMKPADMEALAQYMASLK